MITEMMLRVHRWAGLILAPLFAVILLSGGLLALEPILGKGDSLPRVAVDVAPLTTILERSPIAEQAKTIEVDPDGAAVTLEFERGTPDVRLKIATGAVLSESQQSGFFAILHDFHEGLLLDGKLVVEVAAWVMLGVLLTGPFLAWPHLRNTLSGWHIGIGWILFPLVLMPSATATLRTLGVGRTDIPKAMVSRPSLTTAEAFTRAANGPFG
jgi:sulfite reductase (NADPH) flavoprotein alpha-component